MLEINGVKAGEDFWYVEYPTFYQDPAAPLQMQGMPIVNMTDGLRFVQPDGETIWPFQVAKTEEEAIKVTRERCEKARERARHFIQKCEQVLAVLAALSPEKSSKIAPSPLDANEATL